MCQPLDDVRLGRDTGWDIAGPDDIGYLATNDRRGRTTLYTVDETTGETSKIDRIGGRRLTGLTVTGLAGQPSELTPAHQPATGRRPPPVGADDARLTPSNAPSAPPRTAPTTAGGAQSPNSQVGQARHRPAAPGSTHRNVPDPPKWPKVRGEPLGAVQCGILSALELEPESPGGVVVAEPRHHSGEAGNRSLVASPRVAGHQRRRQQLGGESTQVVDGRPAVLGWRST